MTSPIREELRDVSTEVRARQNWEAIRVRRSPRTKQRVAWAAISLAAVGALASLWFVRGDSGALRTSADVVWREGVRGARVAFADGSSIDARRGELELLENERDRLRVWLRDGAATFDVTPGGTRRWIVEAGSVTVEVMGTRFDVRVVEERVRVDVGRGRVFVRGPTVPRGGVMLGAGESVEASVADLGAALSPRSEVAGPLASSPRPRSAESEATSPERGDTRPRRARDASELQASALDRADTLRAQGRAREAIHELISVADDPRTDRTERALAAFTAGKLLAESDDHAEAIRSFELASTLGLGEPLREDACARRAESLAALRDPRMAEAVDEYLARYPRGRHVERLRSLGE
jgi:transmembrane sensor